MPCCNKKKGTKHNAYKKCEYINRPQSAVIKCMVSESILGSLSNDDDDAEDDAKLKMNLYFTIEIRDCLDLFGSPMALKSYLKLNMQRQRSIPN